MAQPRDTGRTRADTIDNPHRRVMLAGTAASLLAGAAIATAPRGASGASPGAAGDNAAGFVKPEPLPWRNGPRPKPAPVPGDAALIADCQAFIALERRVGALYSGPGRVSDEDERDEALERPVAQQRPLLDRICDTPATTPEGARAKAAALAAWAPDQLKPRDGACWDERLLASLLADLTGRVPT